MPSAIPTETSSSDVLDTPVEVEFPPLYKSQVDNCQFSAWPKPYIRLTPRAMSIRPIPKEFIDYLLEDGIVLPPDSFASKYSIDEEADSDTKYDDDDDDDDDENSDPSLKFKEFHAQVSRAINSLGGAVMPKLNWSAPMDALWISTTNSLKCVSASDIYLLLKSSSYIVHDLTESYSDCIDVNPPLADQEEGKSRENPTFELVLRKWVAINPALEFRCFVKDRAIIGITQRDMNYYDFLEPLSDTLAAEIETFFETNLQQTFADPNFVFDVYVPSPYKRVWLIDINPYAPRTDTHLFSWDELLTINPNSFDFDYEVRLQDKGNSSQNFGGAAHSENHVPKDVVDASLSGEGIVQLARKWQSMMDLQDPDSSDSESELVQPR